MTLLEKIDAVLETLYIHSGENPTFPLLQEWLAPSGIEKGEIEDCLLHLYKEGLIYCEFAGDRTAYYTELGGAHYLISFKGKFFWETIGGYKRQHEISVNDERIKNNREKYLSRGTVWLACLTGFLLLVDLLTHWKELRQLFYYFCH